MALAVGCGGRTPPLRTHLTSEVSSAASKTPTGAPLLPLPVLKEREIKLSGLLNQVRPFWFLLVIRPIPTDRRA